MVKVFVLMKNNEEIGVFWNDDIALQTKLMLEYVGKVKKLEIKDEIR